MSKNSARARLETLRGWLEQTKKNSKYGKKVTRVEPSKEKKVSSSDEDVEDQTILIRGNNFKSKKR